MKILVVEDETALAEIINRALCREGYIVEIASSFAEARSKIGLFEYDCILLDIMLPDGSGLELLRELKRSNKLGGVIIISAKDSIDDKVVGLNLGADDYLAKPFHLSELTARVGSIIRRKGNNGGNLITIGNVTVAMDRSLVTVGGTLLDLSRKEYGILLHFALRNGHVISKNYPKDKISVATMERGILDKDYKVILTNGVKIEFDGSGSWSEIECKRNSEIPMSIIPAKVASYVKERYPKCKVIKVEKDKNTIEVELNNDFELKFNAKGELIKVDR